MESAPKYLSIISEETKRLSRLVRQMLDISRMKDKQENREASFDATVNDEVKLKSLSENVLKLALPDSANIIAKEVIKLAK